MKYTRGKLLCVLGCIFATVGSINCLFVFLSITFDGIIKTSAITFEQHIIIGLSMVLISIGVVLIYAFMPLDYKTLNFSKVAEGRRNE